MSKKNIVLENGKWLEKDMTAIKPLHSVTNATTFTTLNLQIDVSLIIKKQLKYSVRGDWSLLITSIATLVCKSYVVKLVIFLTFFLNE